MNKYSATEGKNHIYIYILLSPWERFLEHIWTYFEQHTSGVLMESSIHPMKVKKSSEVKSGHTKKVHPFFVTRKRQKRRFFCFFTNSLVKKTDQNIAKISK